MHGVSVIADEAADVGAAMIKVGDGNVADVNDRRASPSRSPVKVGSEPDKNEASGPALEAHRHFTRYAEFASMSGVLDRESWSVCLGAGVAVA